MNVEADPNLCANKVTNIKLGSGASGYAFLLRPQAGHGPIVMSFLGTAPKHARHHRGATVLPVHRLYVTIDGKTDDLVALGSCAFSSANKKTPTKVSCSANTVEGKFSGVFVTATPDLSPLPMVSDHRAGQPAVQHVIACGQRPADAAARNRPEAEQCAEPGHRGSP